MVDQSLEKILIEYVHEQRRARRWGVFFKFLLGVVIVLMGVNMYQQNNMQSSIGLKEHTALIDITGPIDAHEDANADNIRLSLKTAFQNKQVKGIILRINSPGGSPVQSRQVYNEIRRLRQEHPTIKLYAAIEDLGTSAAYLIASAADSIYADQTSIVGSIGVKMESFGFVDLMQKAGIERRSYIAGQFKNLLDPFLPVNPAAHPHLMASLQATHQAFIQNVREGRGTRLKENELLFSGLFWSGEEALKLGLIDGFGDAPWIARELIHAKELVDYSPNVTLIDKISRRVGASMATRLLTEMGFFQKGVH